MERLKVIQVGLGPVGVSIARVAASRPGLQMVGGVDPAPGLAGRELADVLGVDAPRSSIFPTIEAALDHERPDVVLHATGSFLADVAGQLRTPLARGVSVVSTCEELAYPFYRHPSLARELDDLARSHEAVLLGTGINPGFVMDKLVLTLLGACRSVRQVRVQRVVDASKRREPLQRKIGVGLTTAEFEERRRTGRFGHIGLAESAHMLADAMGVPGGIHSSPASASDRMDAAPRRGKESPAEQNLIVIKDGLAVGPEAGRAPHRGASRPSPRILMESLEPVIADSPLTTPSFRVETGQVLGISQSAVVSSSGTERVRLELRMFAGAKDPIDGVWIDGESPIEAAIAGGIHGDEGTAAVVVNAAYLVRTLHPGLRTMMDVPIRIAGL